MVKGPVRVHLDPPTMGLQVRGRQLASAGTMSVPFALGGTSVQLVDATLLVARKGR